MQQSQTTLQLPDVVIQIFQYLPPKELGRCECVCLLWKTILRLCDNIIWIPRVKSLLIDANYFTVTRESYITAWENQSREISSDIDTWIKSSEISTSSQSNKTQFWKEYFEKLYTWTFTFARLSMMLDIDAADQEVSSTDIILSLNATKIFEDNKILGVVPTGVPSHYSRMFNLPRNNDAFLSKPSIRVVDGGNGIIIAHESSRKVTVVGRHQLGLNFVENDFSDSSGSDSDDSNISTSSENVSNLGIKWIEPSTDLRQAPKTDIFIANEYNYPWECAYTGVYEYRSFKTPQLTCLSRFPSNSPSHTGHLYQTDSETIYVETRAWYSFSLSTSTKVTAWDLKNPRYPKFMCERQLSGCKVLGICMNRDFVLLNVQVFKDGSIYAGILVCERTSGKSITFYTHSIDTTTADLGNEYGEIIPFLVHSPSQNPTNANMSINHFDVVDEEILLVQCSGDMHVIFMPLRMHITSLNLACFAGMDVLPFAKFIPREGGNHRATVIMFPSFRKLDRISVLDVTRKRAKVFSVDAGKIEKSMVQSGFWAFATSKEGEVDDIEAKWIGLG
ncbi:hypothetical protein HK098_006808 [Nowakowskiella sp. JEL0407]|nr:hypothetical protein HK098_006808 [Nowakowskiella sp. JEL0407]